MGGGSISVTNNCCSMLGCLDFGWLLLLYQLGAGAVYRLGAVETVALQLVCRGTWMSDVSSRTVRRGFTAALTRTLISAAARKHRSCEVEEEARTLWHQWCVKKACRAVRCSRLTLWSEDLFWPNQSWLWVRRKTNQDRFGEFYLVFGLRVVIWWVNKLIKLVLVWWKRNKLKFRKVSSFIFFCLVKKK